MPYLYHSSILNKFWIFIKKKFKIRSWEFLKAHIYRKLDKLIYHKKYNTKELIQFLQKLGLKKDDTIFVHASWDEFYNYNGSIKDFINALIEQVGPEGTIAMPSYPLLRKESSVFDLYKTPTAAGLIAEEFRKYPSVLRSINLHSVSALGPNAEFLTKDHRFSLTSWDEMSPYYRLGQINAKVLTFGLGNKFVGTIMHVADSILRTKLPYFEQFFKKKMEVTFRLQDTSLVRTEFLTQDDNFKLYFTNAHHSRIINKYYSKDKFKRTRFSNLTINQYDAKYFINRSIELAYKGIVVYTLPNPKKYFKN
jgi:aminoglycoside 3-N-acetyltransferase